MVRQYDPAIDMERPPRQFRSHGIPQGRNFDHQQARAPVSQVYRDDVGAAWHAIAAVVRHSEILRTNGAFKVLALGIVLAQVLADRLRRFPAGQPCGVLALACWSTPYVCSFRGDGPGSCIDLNDWFWARPNYPVMSSDWRKADSQVARDVGSSRVPQTALPRAYQKRVWGLRPQRSEGAEHPPAGGTFQKNVGRATAWYCLLTWRALAGLGWRAGARPTL
jgi:hypothetical protein